MLWLVAWVAAAPAHADPDPGAPPTTEELDRVFKQRRRAERAPVMLVVDGAEVAGDGPILLELGHSADAPLVPSAPIVAALVPRLKDEAAVGLLARVHDHHVSLAALRAIGLTATYDPRRLELRIEVPPRLTAVSSHAVGAGAPPDARDALAPSAVSGYVNLRGGGGGTRAGQDGAITHAPLHASSDAAVNVHGWVLEGRGDLAAGATSDEGVVAHRGDIVATHDLPGYAVRVTAGDFAVPPAGLQGSYSILGVGIGRNFTLQPYRAVRPINRFDFVLDRPSTITVLVNGAPVQTLRLPAGRHDLRDLPLGAGVSNVELVIQDSTGLERRLAFSAASPDALLAPGVVELSLSAGVPLVSDLGLRTYDYARPIVSARYRMGVTSMLTLGGALDGDRERQVGGGALSVATNLGNLSVDGAASRDRLSGGGVAAGVRYDYGRTTGGSTDLLTLAGHHFSPGFATLGPPVVGPHYSSDLSIAATARLSRRLVGRLDLRYQIGRGVSDAPYAAIGVAGAFGAVGIDASVSALRTETTPSDVRLFVMAHWVLPGQRSAFNSASRASGASGVTNELGYSRHGGGPTGGLASSARLTEAPDGVGASGTLSYTGYRFTTEASALFDHLGGEGGGSQTASFEAATALAFAGGRFAWSRPISGSFAIVASRPVLDGIEVGVNPARGGYVARADALGPAVVPSLDPYRVNRLGIEAPDLPTGYSLGSENYTLVPTYKSGTLIRVGEPGTVFLRGTLVHQGAPLAFASAELISLDDPRRSPIVLMTNRAGRFGAMGLQAGRYAVQVAGATGAPPELVIPAGTAGMFNAGVVELP